MSSAMVHPPDTESDPLADLTDALPDHTLEHILARVPFVSVGATRCVCKRWQSLTTTSTFLTLCSERQEKADSWLYVNGFRYNITDHTSSPATTSTLELPGYSYGAGNIAYIVISSQLQYKLSPLDPQVRRTPPLPDPHACTHPIVSVVRHLHNGAHMLIVIRSEFESLSTVSVFDSESQSWSMCEDLPAGFGRISTSRSVSAVVCNGRVYLFHIYSRLVTSLDLVTRRWSKCSTLRPPGTQQYCYLAVRHGSLLLVGVNHEQGRFCFRGWNVDAGSMESGMECTGDSWPVVCHFGSYKPAGSFSRPRKSSSSKKKPIDEVPVASSSSCRRLLVAFSNSFRKLTFGTGIVGFFNALDFSEALR